MIDQVGANVSVVSRPLPEDDPRQRSPDITKARAVLGFDPKVPLRDGMTRTIAYFRETLRAG